ncbi:hypothetical protein C8R44DRAFT_800698 [Mycena epipterygia]|nr:hypothetical protein C8R44DRAFT_800698 [Mycena epipterygia]
MTSHQLIQFVEADFPAEEALDLFDPGLGGLRSGEASDEASNTLADGTERTARHGVAATVHLVDVLQKCVHFLIGEVSESTLAAAAAAVTAEELGDDCANSESTDSGANTGCYSVPNNAPNGLLCGLGCVVDDCGGDARALAAALASNGVHTLHGSTAGDTTDDSVLENALKGFFTSTDELPEECSKTGTSLEVTRRGGGAAAAVALAKEREQTSDCSTAENALSEGLDKAAQGTSGEGEAGLEVASLSNREGCGQRGGRNSDESKGNDGRFGEHDESG